MFWRVGWTVAALFGAAACGVPADDAGGTGGVARVAADPSVADAAVAPIADASDAPAQPRTDAADAASDLDADAAPSEPGCGPPTCATETKLATWKPGRIFCQVDQTQECHYGCVEMEAGASCAPPPAQCALGVPPASGQPCAVHTMGLCFDSVQTACDCACPGKTCTATPKGKLKLPGLKLPKKPSDAGSSVPDAAVPSDAAPPELLVVCGS